MDLNLNIQPKPPVSAHSRDTGSDSFEKDVLQASMDKPVIVDFWAPWCGPCRQMMPVLEKAVAGAAGAVAMVKVDIDQNPELAQIFGVKSVPTVFAFFKGHPVDGFAGSKPESEIRAFVAKLVQHAGGAKAAPELVTIDKEAVGRLLAAGDKFFRENDLNAALEQYGLALEADALCAPALSGIGWCLLAQGDMESMREIVLNADEAIRNDPRIKGLGFVIARADEAQALPAGLEEKIAANPKDHAARYDLALKHMGAADLAGAIDQLVELTRRDREWSEQKARKLLVDLFDALGPGHPLTAQGRRKLSSVLFS